MDKKILYKIAKLTAENDSIYEGYRYVSGEYTKKDFEEELAEGNHGETNHASQAVEILELIKKVVKNKKDTAFQFFLDEFADELLDEVE